MGSLHQSPHARVHGKTCSLCSKITWDVRPAAQGTKKYLCKNPMGNVSFYCCSCHRGFCKLCLDTINAKLPETTSSSECPECRFGERTPGRKRKRRSSFVRTGAVYSSHNQIATPAASGKRRKRRRRREEPAPSKKLNKLDGALVFPEFGVALTTSLEHYYVH